jgi:hypothetical protein
LARRLYLGGSILGASLGGTGVADEHRDLPQWRRFSFEERSSRANQLGAFVENIFQRMKWFWKNLKDCVNSDKTDRSTPFNRETCMTRL